MRLPSAPLADSDRRTADSERRTANGGQRPADRDRRTANRARCGISIRAVSRHDPDELQAARAQLVSYSARLLADGLAVGSAGNISARSGDIVAITPSGIPSGEMQAADVCLVTLDGAQLPWGADEAPETPSSETPMHLAVYAA